MHTHRTAYADLRSYSVLTFGKHVAVLDTAHNYQIMQSSDTAVACGGDVLDSVPHKSRFQFCGQCMHLYRAALRPHVRIQDALSNNLYISCALSLSLTITVCARLRHCQLSYPENKPAINLLQTNKYEIIYLAAKPNSRYGHVVLPNCRAASKTSRHMAQLESLTDSHER